MERDVLLFSLFDFTEYKCAFRVSREGRIQRGLCCAGRFTYLGCWVDFLRWAEGTPAEGGGCSEVDVRGGNKFIMRWRYDRDRWRAVEVPHLNFNAQVFRERGVRGCVVEVFLRLRSMFFWLACYGIWWPEARK